MQESPESRHVTGSTPGGKLKQLPTEPTLSALALQGYR